MDSALRSPRACSATSWPASGASGACRRPRRPTWTAHCRSRPTSICSRRRRPPSTTLSNKGSSASSDLLELNRLDMQGAGRTWKRACCLALPACLLSPTALAQAPAEDLPLRIQAAPPHNELFLEVSVNGEASGLILRFTRGKTGLHSTVQNLRDLGQEPKLFGLEGQEEFDLDQVRGLSYEYDASRQTLSLRVSDALREPVQLSARTVRQAAPASVTPGALLNYDIYGQLGKDRSISLLNEVRYFSSGGVFSSNGVWNVGQGQDQYTRFDTYWSHSDPDTLTSWQLGDLVSSSLSWSRSVRLGGVQWRKNFELRPDLLTYPVAAMTGSAVVPSAVDLYIDGVRQVQSSVPSGPFVVRQIRHQRRRPGDAGHPRRGRARGIDHGVHVCRHPPADGRPERLFTGVGRAAPPLRPGRVRLRPHTVGQRRAAPRRQRPADGGGAWRSRQGLAQRRRRRPAGPGPGGRAQRRRLRQQRPAHQRRRAAAARAAERSGGDRHDLYQ